MPIICRRVPVTFGRATQANVPRLFYALKRTGDLERLAPMNRSRLSLPLLALLLAASLFLPALAAAYEHLLIVSIDALHPDALDAKVSPTLHGLMLGGRYTLEGRSVSPPKTLIAHTSMLTGLTPSATASGTTTGDPANRGSGCRPCSMTQRGSATPRPFTSRRPSSVIWRPPRWMTRPWPQRTGAPWPGHSCARPAGASSLLHISGLEYAGSRSGWLSEDYLDTLSSIDLALVPLLEAARKGGDYLILVTSDHAGHDREHGTDHRRTTGYP